MIKLGKPFYSELTCYCHVSIKSELNKLNRNGPLAGVNSFQALCIALEFIKTNIKSYGNQYKLNLILFDESVSYDTFIKVMFARGMEDML